MKIEQSTEELKVGHEHIVHPIKMLDIIEEENSKGFVLNKELSDMHMCSTCETIKLVFIPKSLSNKYVKDKQRQSHLSNQDKRP